MELQVDKAQRFAKMRAHTATHLLHLEIAKIIPNTQQAGSHVDQDYLRFDFQAEKLLSNQELITIEKAVNQHIYEAQEVKTEESSFDEAKKKGAKAFFEDKYGDIVRVVSICKEGEDKGHSVELCGGTHVDNTSKIGAFAIIGQEAVASGIKRIIAVTGPKVYEELENIKSEYENQAAKLGVTRKQFPDKLDKDIKELEELENKHNSLLNQYFSIALKTIDPNTIKDLRTKKINCYHIKLDSSFNKVNFKVVVEHIKNSLGEQYGNILVSNQDGNYAIMSKEEKSKAIQKLLNLKGGGSNNIVQGKDTRSNSLKGSPIEDIFNYESTEESFTLNLDSNKEFQIG